jgi:hypothetical protein
MIQSFQCPICGNLNALGEPECSECGQGFAYSCPVCGSQLNNRYPTCPNCRTVFNWGATARPASQAAGPTIPQEVAYAEQQAAPAGPTRGREGGGAAAYMTRPVFWLTLMAVCAVIIALLLIADVIINK